MRRAFPLLIALGLVAAVVVPYLALGGASFEPTPVADPCASREWRDPGDVQEALEQIALSALDGAACELGVTREELVLAVRNEEALDEFADEQGISRENAEQAVRDGMLRAVEDAEKAGAIWDTSRRLRGVSSSQCRPGSFSRRSRTCSSSCPTSPARGALRARASGSRSRPRRWGRRTRRERGRRGGGSAST